MCYVQFKTLPETYQGRFIITLSVETLVVVDNYINQSVLYRKIILPSEKIDIFIRT